jgi:hypothetical protein
MARRTLAIAGMLLGLASVASAAASASAAVPGAAVPGAAVSGAAVPGARLAGWTAAAAGPAGRTAGEPDRPSVRAPDPASSGATQQLVIEAVLAPPAGTLGHRLRAYFQKPSTLVLLGVLVVCSLVLVVLRRRTTRPQPQRRNRTADEQ